MFVIMHIGTEMINNRNHSAALAVHPEKIEILHIEKTIKL